MAIIVAVMCNQSPFRRVPIVMYLDENRPGLERDPSLSFGATVEMSGTTL